MDTVSFIRFVIQHRPTASLRISSLADFRAYMQAVWAATDDYLLALDPATVDEQGATIKPAGGCRCCRQSVACA